MTEDIAIVSPIEPHHLDKKQRFHFEDLVRRVSLKSVHQGLGRDLLLRVYLAGLYHGIKVGAEYQLSNAALAKAEPSK